jgi:hypothetical protein
MHHRMIVETADRAARSAGPAPIGAELEIPPLAPVAGIDRVLGRGEHQRAGLEHMRQGAGIVPRIGRNLGKRDVARGVDESAKLAIGDRRAVDPEAVHRDAMDRSLLGIMLIRSHAKRAAGNPDHVCMSRRVARRNLTSRRWSDSFAHLMFPPQRDRRDL